MKYTVEQIATLTHSKFYGDGNKIVKNIAFDSRTIYSSKDTAFLAIKTTKNNGEKYITSAIEKGINIIISENQLFDDESISWIIVKNSIKFIQKLAQYHFSIHPIQSMGITGSNGKTIVKEWLYQALHEDISLVKSPKSFNSQLGLPLSLLNINSKHQLGIFEVGISKPGEMQILEDIFSPKIGILTHIGTAHIANFNNEEQLIKEKITLFKNSELIIFNGDHPKVLEIIKSTYPEKQKISYGLQSHNDVFIDSDWQNRQQEIEVHCFGERITFSASQRDEATLTNILCIITVLHNMGLSKENIANKINLLKAVEMRLESVKGIRNNLIINDSFNLDLDSLKIAYQFIKEYTKQNKSLVITDFVESSCNTNELYKEVIQLTNEQNFDTIFLIGEEIKSYQTKFKSKTFAFDNVDDLIKNKELNNIENQLILLKGARLFEIEKVKTYLEFQKHDTVLEINLNKILHNIHTHKSLLKPETKIMAMVKAYSYGLGGYEIAEFLQHHHIDYLGVAVADEGIDLRKNGITVPIIVMNPEQHSYNAIIEYNLEPNIYSFRILELFHNQLKQRDFQDPFPIHVKLETGMHRLGFKEEEIDRLLISLKSMNVRVSSIFSHLSSADIPEEKDYTLKQIQTFERLCEKISMHLGYKPIRHILNSSGILNFPEYQFDMVRIGIGMVGISYNENMKPMLQTAVTFKSVISQISEIKKGESIGYSRAHKAEKPMRIATIPVGYADGIPRLLSNGKGYISIKGKPCPIVGNVCMDMIMVNLGEVSAKEGDEIIIFNEYPSLEEFSKSCRTIPYEVLTSISRRVKRIYIKN